MMKSIVCVMLGAVLFACGNKEAQPEATSPTTSASVASAPTPSASASTTPAPVVASASAASSSTPPVQDEGVVIQIKGNLILVNGSPADTLGTRLDDLAAKLKSTRDVWTKTHAGQTFPGRATLKVEKATPAAGIAHIIDVAHAAGYPSAAVANP